MVAPLYLQLARRMQEALTVLLQSSPARSSDLRTVGVAASALLKLLCMKESAADQSVVAASHAVRHVLRETELVQWLCKSMQIFRESPLPAQGQADPDSAHMMAEAAGAAANVIMTLTMPFVQDVSCGDLTTSDLLLSQVDVAPYVALQFISTAA